MPLKDFMKGISSEKQAEERERAESRLSDQIKRANRLLEESLGKMLENDYETADQQLREARDIYWREEDPQGIVQADIRLALMYEEIFNSVPEAINLYQEAVRLCQKMGAKYDEITAHLELATCYLKNNEKPQAKKCYERASLLADELNDNEAKSRILIESQAVNAKYIISSRDIWNILDKRNEAEDDG